MTRKRWSVISSVIVAAVVGWLTAGRVVTGQPPATPSCHEPFRGKKSVPFIAPRQNMELLLPEEQWPSLQSLLQDFAKEHGWDFRDSSRFIPGELNSIDVSLCSDSQRVLVVENHWLNTRVFDHPDRGLSVVLYSDAPAEAWQRTGKELFQELEAKWPGAVRFRGRDGELVSRPAYLD